MELGRKYVSRGCTSGDDLADIGILAAYFYLKHHASELFAYPILL